HSGHESRNNSWTQFLISKRRPE
ncbi:unnamed protein product, partial [Allacma fusca]